VTATLSPETPVAGVPRRTVPLRDVLGEEGFRVFFPLAALHLALWPWLWTAVHGLGLPFASTVPPGLWHAREMLIGGFGATLIGFMTTAVPEWTDTPRLQHGRLFALAGLWGAARIVGLLGIETLVPAAAVLDFAWMAALVVYILHVSRVKRTTRLLAFAGWIVALATAGIVLAVAFHAGNTALAQQTTRVLLLIWCGVLGLALSRIVVPVTNLVLDPTERTSPYRPHPGRLNLASGLAALAIAGEIWPVSPAVSGFLWIAAGAAFMDRVAEAFVGREMLCAEVVSIAGANALAGLGLLLVGAGRLGVPIAETTALHVTAMGGPGFASLLVFCIAGLLHTGKTLPLGGLAKLALVLAAAAVPLRIAPDLGWFMPPGPAHAAASTVWAAAFLIWLKAYWPAISDPATMGARTC
jgi:uncharacterized protein involved in response to NO